MLHTNSSHQLNHTTEVHLIRFILLEIPPGKPSNGSKPLSSKAEKKKKKKPNQTTLIICKHIYNAIMLHALVAMRVDVA